ncbi:MAG: translation initiation factor IF-2 [bacterium]|nr:translation initiation factor IF-2 [bacterium]
MATATEQQNTNTQTRPPIVVVMGHIDHGKTKLLDTIRKENVVDKESGGITQHIGAYEAEVSASPGEIKKITFLDTPGHGAFSNMRARGAHVADIAILVIAADDGIKPQTIEALETIQKAHIPFIVAINKIDKTGADPDKVKKELAEKEVLVEEWGGKTPAIAISAKEGTGIHDLLEMILLVAELEDLKANPNMPAEGVIIESHLEPKRGNTATILITNGTLKQGDFIVAGNAFSPVRIFENFRSVLIRQALPSQPARIIGFNVIPEVGLTFKTVKTKKEAEAEISRTKDLAQSSFIPPPAAKEKTNEEEQKPHIVPLVLKADATGSLEAIEGELKKLEKENLVIKIIKKGVGSINEDDAKIAGSTKGSAIIGFHVKIEKEALPLAERFGVAIKTFEIIYELVEWAQSHMKATAPEDTREIVIGEAHIIKVFSTKGSKQIVGGKVLSGIIKNKSKVNILRRGTVIAQGRIVELQHKKTDVGEVSEGNDFGVRIDSPTAIAEKDTIQALEEKTEKQPFS